jgi:hypothetical protein
MNNLTFAEARYVTKTPDFAGVSAEFLALLLHSRASCLPDSSYIASICTILLHVDYPNKYIPLLELANRQASAISMNPQDDTIDTTSNENYHDQITRTAFRAQLHGKHVRDETSKTS